MQTSDKNVNYTDEMMNTLTTMYQELGNDGIDQIATTLNKSVRSIRSKLVREGVYVAVEKGSASKSDGPSKKEILRELESKGLDTLGLEGATKVALARLLNLKFT